MKENPKTTTSTTTVLGVTVALLLPVFAVGVMIGRATLERSAEGRAEPDVEPGVSGELTACQEELEAPSQAQAAPSVPAAPREEAKRDATGPAAEVEELAEAVRECKKRDLLTKAEVCIAARRAFDMVMSSPEGFLSCGSLIDAREIIERNSQKCVELGDLLEGLNRDQLTEDEARRVRDAAKVREALDKEAMVERVEAAFQACYKKRGTYR